MQDKTKVQRRLLDSKECFGATEKTTGHREDYRSHRKDYVGH
jgi:hypothetical protein